MFSSWERQRALQRVGRFTGLVVCVLLWGAATALGAEPSSDGAEPPSDLPGDQRYIFFDLTTPKSGDINNRVFIAPNECGNETWIVNFVKDAERVAKTVRDGQENLADKKKTLSSAEGKLKEAQTAFAEAKVEFAAAKQEKVVADQGLFAVRKLVNSEDCKGSSEPLCRQELTAATLRVSVSGLREEAASSDLEVKDKLVEKSDEEYKKAKADLEMANKTSFADAVGLYERLSGNRQKLASCSGQRWVTGRAKPRSGKAGDNAKAIAIVFFDADGNQPKITFEEEVRKSQIGKDISSVMGLLAAAGVLKETEGEPAIHLTSAEYVLTRTRATLTVKASLEYDKEGGKETLEQQAVVLTGPREHWFLSVDFPVTDVTTLKFNSDAERLEPTDTSSTYVGASYMFGDLVAENRGGVVLKALLSLSSDPLDSYGLGLGYRFRATKAGGFDFRAFSPFVGVTWTREDEVLNDGTPSRGSGHSVDFVGGISFNIDVGLGMLK